VCRFLTIFQKRKKKPGTKKKGERGGLSLSNEASAGSFVGAASFSMPGYIDPQAPPFRWFVDLGSIKFML